MGRIDRLLYRKERNLWEKMALFPLQLFSMGYEGAVRLRLLSYSLGILTSKRLPFPVISVGNITAGGTGKTPLVMSLAAGLKEKGIPVAILSRGYKRASSSGTVVSDGKKLLLPPLESGDEPFLMAKNVAGVPVLVGKDRFVIGQIGIREFGVRALLLDDGYQHLRLERDLDILLIDSEIGFGDGHLLPRGILREPLSQLRRADIFLLTKVENAESCRRLEEMIHQIRPSTPVFHSHYEPVALIGPNGERDNAESLRGKKILAVSGIGNPGYFASLLRKSGAEVAAQAVFSDHHRYSPEDLLSIDKKSRGLDSIVTTEKDMLKWIHLNFHPFSLRALRIGFKIWEEEAFCRRIMEVLSDRGKHEERLAG